ncbi:hypothetical protein K431DRAFT_281186 [Polychaeton citri CBS 116435]|uniref:FAD-binding FR-type domain-containing protein n=1 Tax=Polychaeton citri CBS 116435 TaxID=1314669 RepID=A0A9P4UTY6_9PEZI|nr:hypothetical protein K431DRAFT_281186 [Polychaeton citri CBS 116435]
MSNNTTRPATRRHSFSFGTHRHTTIPTCDTSHPDNPIPTEPKSISVSAMAPSLRAKFSTSSSPRSSAGSLGDTTDSATDSSAPTTPNSEAVDSGEEFKDTLNDLPPPAMSPRTKRRASTTYASNPEDIRRILGDSNGTAFLQKYCCGEGCCMIQKLNIAPVAGTTPVVTPDNFAFKHMNPKVATLTLETDLTKLVDLPEQKVSFGSIRRQSISEKFPEESRHEHDAAAVNHYPPRYMQPHPPYNVYSAPVYGARELTKPGAEKRTFHFDIDVTEYPEEGGVDFKVGGAIGVCPPNDPALVEDIFDQIGVPRFLRDKPIRLLTNGGRWPTIWGEEASRELVTTRRELLTWTVDISSVAPTKPLFRLLGEHASDEHEKKILLFLASAQGQAAFCELRTGPYITLQQLLHAFPSSHPPLEHLLSSLPQLMPRFYSLSNDPHVSSTREGLAGRRLIEIAVTVHENPTYTSEGATRTGVGSGFLERVAKQFVAAEEQAAFEAGESGQSVHPGVAGRRLNLQIPMFRGLMANPLSKEFASDGPMMLIGAGVGMAPFRGFILNRLKNANCANKIWLVQGVRDSMLDEIYSGELGTHEKEIKKVVQSRVHQPPPAAEDDDDVQSNHDNNKPAAVKKESNKANQVAKYVQDEVRMQADIVWFVVNAVDGRIFVCGSTKGMGEGVERALIDVAMDKGHLDFETAKQFWQGKKDAGQYIAETW